MPGLDDGCSVSLKDLARNLLSQTNGQALLLARFIRKLPALWRQEQAMAQHQGSHSNRIFIKGTDHNEFYPIYSPEDRDTTAGSYIRTYSLFCHQANAWYMRNELNNFINEARKVSSLADIGSAEGFYSALFASMHPGSAQILSVDCGSSTGCIPEHSQSVLKQNSAAFSPKRWDYVKAFITGPQKQRPSFSLPQDCQVTTLPELFEAQNFHPQLIKLDIESSEFDALEDPAMLRYLQEHKPCLIIEVHNLELSQRGLKFDTPLQKLNQAGFEVCAFDVPNYLEAGNCHVVIKHISKEAN